MGRDVQCDPVTKRRETRAVGASPREPGVEADRVAAGEGRRLGLYRGPVFLATTQPFAGEQP